MEVFIGAYMWALSEVPWYNWQFRDLSDEHEVFVGGIITTFNSIKNVEQSKEPPLQMMANI